MIIKCKMCGGELNIVDGSRICECEFCGTQQTTPSADSDKKVNLFNRANRLRMNAEFDKAATVYASITAEFPEEAEAYWGLCLCKYGIEYVDDPLTGKKMPTCHRTLTNSIMDDSDYDQAREYADSVAKRMYRDEAKEIDRIQKSILEIVEQEPPYDVFICYKETDDNGNRTEDSVLAQDIYDNLTGRGLRVFFARISLEDKIGEQYEPYIYAALHSSKVMLVIGTDYEYFDAVWVKNEWARFLDMMKTDRTKKLIPCYKDIDAYDMPKEFKNLQAQDMGKLGWEQDLTRGVQKLCGNMAGSVQEQRSNQYVVAPGSPTIVSLLERAHLFLEDGEWSEANQYADKVLDIEPKNPNAYFIKLLSDCHIHTEEQYALLNEIPEKSANYQKANRFSDETLNQKIEKWNQEIRNRKEHTRKAAILQRAMNEIKVADTQEKYQQIMEELDSIAGFEGVDEVRKSLENRHKQLEKIQDKLAALQEEIQLFSDLCEYEEEKNELGLFSGKRRNELESLTDKAKARLTELDQKYSPPGESIQHIPRRDIEKELQYRIANEYYHAGLLSEAADYFASVMGYKDVDETISGDEILSSLIPALKLSQSMSEGSYISFGRYQQSEDLDSKEEILWFVLETRRDKCLLMCKDGLEAMAYHDTLEKVSWENSSLRKWLNGKFINTAFTKEEMGDILTTNVDNTPEEGSEPIFSNNNTQDKIFLLSKDEAMRYFNNDKERIGTATEYAASRGSYNEWWLRSSGSDQHCALCVNSSGMIQSYYVNTETILVRPCLWMDLTSMISEQDNS